MGARLGGDGELALLEAVVKQAFEDYTKGPTGCRAFNPAQHLKQQERLAAYASAVEFLEEADLLDRVQALHQVPDRPLVVQSELGLGVEREAGV